MICCAGPYRQFGEAQLRYGRYFQQIVTPGTLPALRKHRLTLSRVTLRGMQSESHTLKTGSRGSETERPTKQWSQWEGPGGQPDRLNSPVADPPEAFLVIYQRGRLIWADEAAAQVRTCLICASVSRS